MSSAFETLLEEVKGSVNSVTVEEAHGRLDNGNQVVLIDVREREDFAEGYIPSAQKITKAFKERSDANAQRTRYTSGSPLTTVTPRLPQRQ